jgi:uncharacterized membrane-anchored protein YjiN (DUF445 family)
MIGLDNVSPLEQEQQHQLTRMRRIATGLFACMVMLFFASRLLQPFFGWLEYVAAFAEAAMIGAIADWFAVTALFRAPLGLPIPHTAVIPSNKDRIGASIANFLEHNFLTREVISKELLAIDFAGVGAQWLVAPGNSRAVSVQLGQMLPAVLRLIEDEDVGRFLEKRVSTALSTFRFGPLSGDLLSLLTAQQHHWQLFDYLIELASTLLDQNSDSIRQKIHERSPRWIPKAIDEKIFNALLEGTQNWLAEVAQEGSPARIRFQEMIDELIINLRKCPETEEKIRSAIVSTAQHPLFKEYMLGIWREMKFRTLTDLRADDSRFLQKIEQGLVALGIGLAHDRKVCAKLNAWFGGFATEVIISHRSGIADLVRRVIQTWDAETVSRKFELYVGRDLQYIRINGTVVGGLVGLVLHAISRLL